MDILANLAAEPLDLTSAIPLYEQLKGRILQLIATRAIGEDTPLPTEQDIADALHLSRGTVRRCFKDLVEERRVVRRRGMGTFVNYVTEEQPMDIAFNYTSEITRLGMEPSSKVLSIKRRAASGGVANRLRVDEGTKVWEIRRVRLANGKPMQYVCAYVPTAVLPEVSAEALAASLYELILDASGLMPARAEEVYEAVNVDSAEAKALDVPPRTAAMRTIRTTYDQLGRPFECSIIVSRADRNRFMVALDGNGSSFSKVTSRV